MKWFPRLVAHGFAGTTSPPPFSFDLTSQRYFAAAKRSGGLRNLERLRGLEELQEEPELDAAAALILTSRRVFPRAWAGKAAWSSSAMSSVRELPAIFGRKNAGLIYENDGVGASFLSTFTIQENQPFTERVFLFEPEPFSTAERDALETAGLDPRNVWECAFGQWLFRIVDGNFEISRKSTNWTQAKQDELDALLNLSEPSSAEQEEIDNFIGPRKVEPAGVSFPNAIYDVHQSLDLGKPVERQEGKYYELSFIPEPRGRLSIQLAGGKPDSVEIPEILAARTTGKIYNATTVRVSTSGQSFAWQPGYFAFRPSGSLTIGPFKTAYWAANLGALVTKVLKDDSLPGTSVTIEHIVHNSIWFSFKVTVTTSDSRYSPFLYGAQANLIGGPRTAGDYTAWDSSESLDGNGFPPIIDVVPQCEGGSNAAMRRQQYQMIIRDPAGTALAGLVDDNNFDALENRMVDLSAGSSLESQWQLITGGLVTASQVNDARRVRSTTGGVLQAVRQWLCLKKTRLHLTISDAWALLDEEVMTDSVIGDGRRLGDYLRLQLQNAGFTTAQIAGISATAGRILPSAALGENPCVRPEREQTRGDFLRGLIEKYGRGWILWIDQNGIWQFGPRATSIKIINGHAVEFQSSTSRNNAYSWPGRFAVLSPLDHIRESAEFYNYFRVEGWIDPRTGQRLSDEYIIHESIQRTSIWASLKFIGRLKRYQTLRDDGLRTPDDVHEALTNLVDLYGRSCRFVQFTTYFHVGLMPGDLVKVDGKVCEVVRIAGGSMQKDRMTLVVMELDNALSRQLESSE